MYISIIAQCLYCSDHRERNFYEELSTKRNDNIAQTEFPQMLNYRRVLEKYRILIICWVGWFLLAACSPSPLVSETQTTTADVPIPEMSTAIHADVILTESRHQLPTAVHVGEIINVRVVAEAQWTINYRAEVLEALTPPEAMNQPGSTGWFFRASAPGSTEIFLESIPPECPAGTVCPPNLMRFVFPIQVEN